MQKRIRRPRGASLSEYAFVIAFVGVLIAVAFSIGNGTFFKSVANCKNSAQTALTRMNAAAHEAGKPAPPL